MDSSVDRAGDMSQWRGRCGVNVGNVLEQILRQGMAGQSRMRLEHSVGPGGLGGVPGLDDLLGSVLGGQTSGRAGGGLGDILRGGPPGQASGGGLGDILGSLLGAATGGASRGAGGLDDLLGGGGRRSGGQSGSGAGMAILATLAMAALRNWSQSRSPAMGLTGAAANLATDHVEAMTTPETEQLMLRAMISAAKADGAVDEAEIEHIVGRIDDDGVSAAEKEFLLAELRKPLDVPALVRAVPNPAVAAQVYGASLLAMDIDTEAEAAYLRRLAADLDLDQATVARLHQLTGAPEV
jgi:uncharacterized membrane protein YebE (DUF533 family)